MVTTVVNLRHSGYDVYIGRAKDDRGYFGNPHACDNYCKVCRRYHDREDSIKEYSKYFYSRLKSDSEFKRRVLELKGKVLGCFCAPLACHGNVIANWVDRQ